MNLTLFRPAPAPDVNTEQAGIVWYYLTDAGKKLVPTSFIYRRVVDEGSSTLHVYGGECNGYIYSDDTAASWESVSVHIEADLVAAGWAIADRPDGFEVARNGDGSVAEESVSDVLVRQAESIVAAAREYENEMFVGANPPSAHDRQRSRVHINRLADLVDALRGRLAGEQAWATVAVEANRQLDAYLRTVSPRAAEGYGMPVDGVRHAIEDHHAVAEALWRLLDDIDTQGDACRDNDRAFRERTRAIFKRRFALADSDGYRLYWKHRGEAAPEPGPPQAGKVSS